MKLYRLTSVLSMSVWPEKAKAFLEIAPAFANSSKGAPKAGEKKFDYENAIRVSFQTSDMLQAAFDLQALAHGGTKPYKKFADMSKSSHTSDNDKKSLTIQPGRANGDEPTIFVGLTKGNAKLSVSLSPSEISAIAKWLEFNAQYFVNQEIEASKNSFSRKTDDE